MNSCMFFNKGLYNLYITIRINLFKEVLLKLYNFIVRINLGGIMSTLYATSSNAITTDTISSIITDNFDYDGFVLKVLNKDRTSELPIILKSLGALYNYDTSENCLHTIKSLNTKKDNKLAIIHELKHSLNNIFTITPEDLEEKINYAEKLHLPVHFAVPLNGIWGLFEPEQIERANYTLEIKDFLGEFSRSQFDRELSTCSYMFEDNVTIKSIYIHTNPLHYGELYMYEFYYDDELIFSITKDNEDFFVYQYILRGLQDAVAEISTVVKRDETYTTVIESTKNAEYIIVPEYKFILPCLERMIHEESKHHFVKKIDEKKNPYICVEVIREALHHLVELGVGIIVLKDSDGYTFEKYKRLFWDNNS